LASRLRLKLARRCCIGPEIPRRQGIGFASAIETPNGLISVDVMVMSPGDWLRVCD